MTRCIIVDDEPLAQQVLQTYINATEGLSLTATCFTAIEAFEVLHRQAVDLLFLDIKMPAVSGIDFIRSLKEVPAFIFTTAFAEFAATSYDLNAVDYLLKPVTYERFRQSIARYQKQQTKNLPLSEPDFIYLKVNGELIKLFHADILYAQSLKDYIRVTTNTGHYLTHLTMKALMELLPSTGFARIHRSWLVNRKHLQVIGRNHVVIAGVSLPVSENYRPIDPAIQL